MTPIKRTCATCCAFNPSATDDEEVCGNLTSIIIHDIDEDGKPLVIYRAPYASFRCDSHKTHEEARPKMPPLRCSGSAWVSSAAWAGAPADEHTIGCSYKFQNITEEKEPNR